MVSVQQIQGGGVPDARDDERNELERATDSGSRLDFRRFAAETETLSGFRYNNVNVDQPLSTLPAVP